MILSEQTTILRKKTPKRKHIKNPPIKTLDFEQLKNADYDELDEQLFQETVSKNLNDDEVDFLFKTKLKGVTKEDKLEHFKKITGNANHNSNNSNNSNFPSEELRFLSDQMFTWNLFTNKERPKKIDNALPEDFQNIIIAIDKLNKYDFDIKDLDNIGYSELKQFIIHMSDIYEKIVNTCNEIGITPLPIIEWPELIHNKFTFIYILLIHCFLKIYDENYKNQPINVTLYDYIMYYFEILTNEYDIDMSEVKQMLKNIKEKCLKLNII